jgi:hypothetical protein
VLNLALECVFRKVKVKYISVIINRNYILNEIKKRINAGKLLLSLSLLIYIEIPYLYILEDWSEKS